MNSSLPNTEQKLAELCTNIFSLALWLRTQSDLGAPENLRQKILPLFTKMETEGAQRGVPPVDLREAKFALTALLDETLMGSSWPGKSNWEKRMLQDELFNTTNAGEEFFIKLEQLRRAESKETAVLEVFHWCLLLGFEGKYNDRETLDTLIWELSQELGLKMFSLQQELSPGLRPLERASHVRQRSPISAGIICAVCMVGSLLCFLILENRLSAQAETVKARLEWILAKPSPGQEGAQRTK